MKIIKVAEKFTQFDDYWHPRIIGELNRQYIKIAKIKGDFIWHSHKKEDELFYVIKGELIMEFRDKTLVLQPGEMIIVPKGVEHRPKANVETHIVLFEPKSTLNTGEIENELTHKDLDKI